MELRRLNSGIERLRLLKLTEVRAAKELKSGVRTYVALPSRRKMQDRENCSVADTTFFDKGLNLSLTSVCVGMGLAYCFMFMLLVAKAFLRPDGDSYRCRK